MPLLGYPTDGNDPSVGEHPPIDGCGLSMGGKHRLHMLCLLGYPTDGHDPSVGDHPPIDGYALSMGEQTPAPRIPSSRIPSYRRLWPVCGDCTTGEGRGMGCYSNTLLAAVTVPVDTGSTARQCTTMHCMMRTFHREESGGVRNLESRHIA